jgi:hypothetical protein
MGNLQAQFDVQYKYADVKTWNDVKKVLLKLVDKVKDSHV